MPRWMLTDRMVADSSGLMVSAGQCLLDLDHAYAIVPVENASEPDIVSIRFKNSSARLVVMGDLAISEGSDEVIVRVDMDYLALHLMAASFPNK